MQCTMYIGIGRGELLPKHVKTLWKIVENAHEDMTAKISYEKVVVAIPEAVMAQCSLTKPITVCLYAS